MAEEKRCIGGLLGKWRRVAGLSQAALADALGIQQATISKLESGTSKLSVEQLLSYLGACGLTLSDVAEEIDAAVNLEDRPLWERINE